MGENEFTYNVEFTEFIPLFYGLVDVWIGDGSMPPGQTYIDTQGNTRYFGGTAGYLYGRYHNGFVQGFGFVSDYEAVKQYMEDHGLSVQFTYAEWVEYLSSMPDFVSSSQAWAIGERGNVEVAPTDETHHNNAKWYAQKANESAQSCTDQIRDALKSPQLTGIPTAPTANPGTNNTQIATTAFVQEAFASNDAMVYKGTIGGVDATVQNLPSTHKRGWTYRVAQQGTYAGKVCETGDMIICNTDGTSASDSHWNVVQTNIDGAVVGPVSSTSDHVALFNGTTGKVIKDGGTIQSLIIDDAASDGEVDKTWSANKIYNQLELKAPKESPEFTGSISLGRKSGTTIGSKSFAVGEDVTASGAISHAEGEETEATNRSSHAEGYLSKATGAYSHAEGPENTAKGQGSHAEGCLSTANGDYSHTEGYQTSTGNSNTPAGHSAHAEGNRSQAKGDASHAEGYLTIALGNNAHAEGNDTFASYANSHAEGFQTTASANGAHAEGHSVVIEEQNTSQRTVASGWGSHAEGGGSLASGVFSHAENELTTASGNASHAEGQGTIANHFAQHASGTYNVADTSSNDPDQKGNYIEIVGNGATENTRSNARILDWSGNEYLRGTLYVNGINANATGGNEVATKNYVAEATVAITNSQIDILFI